MLSIGMRVLFSKSMQIQVKIAFGIVYTIIFNLIKEIMSSKSLIKYMQIKQKNDYE